jgi:IS4 transposase
LLSTEWGLRSVIEAAFKSKHESILSILKRLLKALEQKNIRINKLLLDRGFYKAEVINFLNREKIPYLIPVIKNRRAKRLIILSDPGTILTLRLGVAIHTLMIVLCKEKKIAFATNIAIDDSKQAQFLADTYRKRWDIETCFRQIHQQLPRTTTLDPKVRYFYFMLIVVVFNLWVVLNIKLSERQGIYWTPIVSIFDLLAALAEPVDLKRVLPAVQDVT